MGCIEPQFIQLAGFFGRGIRGTGRAEKGQGDAGDQQLGREARERKPGGVLGKRTGRWEASKPRVAELPEPSRDRGSVAARLLHNGCSLPEPAVELTYRGTQLPVGPANRSRLLARRFQR